MDRIHFSLRVKVAVQSYGESAATETYLCPGRKQPWPVITGLQTQQKWWARRWQFQIGPLSRVVVWELYNTLLTLALADRDPIESDRAETQENTKTNIYFKCMHICPVKSSVRFCFRFVYLKAEYDSPLAISGAIQRACKDTMLYNRLHLYHGLQKNPLHTQTGSHKLPELATETTYCS